MHWIRNEYTGHPGGLSTRRLDDLVRTNLVTDLVAQVAVLVVVIPFVFNRWMILLWLCRWIPISAIVSSRGSIRRGQIDLAVAKLCVGHTLGVLASCALLPELGPLALLVLVGDLSLLHFGGERLRRQLVIGLPIGASIGALLCLQSWTDLADSAAKELVVVAIVLHTIGTGIAVAQSHRDTYLDLAELSHRLFGMQDRISEAIFEARQQIASSIIEGPIAALHALHSKTIELNAEIKSKGTHINSAAFAEQCADCSSNAQLGLKALRSLSHGAIPDLLRKHGLSVALVSLLEPLGHTYVPEPIERRFEPWMEGALYLCAVETVRFAAQHNVRIEASLRYTETTVWLDLRSLTESNESFRFSPLVLDRLGAIGAFVDDRANGSGLDLTVDVLLGAGADADQSTAPSTVPSAVLPTVPANDHSEVEHSSPNSSSMRILDSFVRSSLIAAWSGLFAMISGWALFGFTTFVYVAGCMAVVLVLLTVARARLRKNDFEGCVIAMCIEIFGAGLFVTLLEPRAAPITGLITTLPVVLGLPHFTTATLRWITALQVAALCSVMVFSFFHVTIIESTIPLWFLVVALPPVAGGVAFLVAGAVLTTIDETRRASSALRSSLREIVSRADAEQQAIERDLHDGAQQQFVAISMQFKMMPKLAAKTPDRAQILAAKIVDQLRRTREELIALAEGSSLAPLRYGDLQGALMTAVERTPERLRLEYHRGVPALSPQVAKAVYYCCMEAVQNSFKYSGDHSQVRVSVACNELDSVLRFEIVDDGIGFDFPTADRSGQGLVSMKNRMSELGGDVEVRSIRGDGTVVSGSLPLQPNLDSHLQVPTETRTIQ
jgi:signal transduction histidine kinase